MQFAEEALRLEERERRAYLKKKQIAVDAMEKERLVKRMKKENPGIVAPYESSKCTDTDNGATDAYGDGCAGYTQFPSGAWV